MAILPIYETPHSILRQKSAPLAKVDDGARSLMQDMLDTMYHAPGIGLAAIQVGVAKRIIVIDLQIDQQKEPHYFVNPEILATSESLQFYQEGCLSVPEQYAQVLRPEEITLSYLDYHGEPQEKSFNGLMATCLQHEIDHLNGVLFIDHLSRLKRSMLLRKLEKERRLKS